MNALLVLDALMAAVRWRLGESASVRMRHDDAIVLVIEWEQGQAATARGSDLDSVILSAAREYLKRRDDTSDARLRLATLIRIDDYRRRARGLRRASEEHANDDARAHAASLLEAARECEAAAAALEKQLLLEDA
jgi:hypothetical protein